MKASLSLGVVVVGLGLVQTMPTPAASMQALPHNPEVAVVYQRDVERLENRGLSLGNVLDAVKCFKGPCLSSKTELSDVPASGTSDSLKLPTADASSTSTSSKAGPSMERSSDDARGGSTRLSETLQPFQASLDEEIFDTRLEVLRLSRKFESTKQRVFQLREELEVNIGPGLTSSQKFIEKLKEQRERDPRWNDKSTPQPRSEEIKIVKTWLEKLKQGYTERRIQHNVAVSMGKHELKALNKAKAKLSALLRKKAEKQQASAASV